MRRAMRSVACTVVWTALFNLTPSASAQSGWPVADDADFQVVRRHVEALQKDLRSFSASLPARAEAELSNLVATAGPDSARAWARVQELLDPLCLVGVSINPESRVKAARGPAKAELLLGRVSHALVKVVNEAGVTHALSVSGPQLIAADSTEGFRWLDARIEGEKPLSQALSGHKLEYVILRLKAREAGKREATLKFDVGQGSQDLGFRAEVPILSTVKRTN